MVLQAGDRAPSFTLVDVDSGEPVSDPWLEGPVALAFFKVTCPVCQMVAPKVGALPAAGARVVAVGEDPPPALRTYRDRFGQQVTTLSEPAPYRVSAAYGLAAVPTLLLVGQHGVVLDVAPSWDREAWNRLALAAGATKPISAPGDGLPPFRPG